MRFHAALARIMSHHAEPAYTPRTQQPARDAGPDLRDTFERHRCRDN